MKCGCPTQRGNEIRIFLTYDLGVTEDFGCYLAMVIPTNSLLSALKLPFLFLSQVFSVSQRLCQREGEGRVGESGGKARVVIGPLQHLYTDLGPQKPTAGHQTFQGLGGDMALKRRLHYLGSQTSGQV